MSTPAPTSVTLKLDREYNVTFDVDTILRIESATGRPVMDIAAMMFGGNDRGANLVRQVPLGVVIDFVAGCVGATHDQAAAWARQGLAFPAFIASVPAFVAAVDTLLGGLGRDEEASRTGPTQPAESGAPLNVQASTPAT